MQTFKKILCSFVCFLAMVIGFSIFLVAPYYKNEPFNGQDASLRARLAGSLDFLVSGASYGYMGFDTRILDRELGCSSYNLSWPMEPLHGRYWLLKKELARNPVKSVVLELSEDRLTRDQEKDYANGDAMVMARMDSFSERLKYAVQYLAIDDWANVTSRHLKSGMAYWMRIMSGNLSRKTDESLKGFFPSESTDVTLSPEQVRTTCIEAQKNNEFQPREENVKELQQTIDLCRQYDTRIIISVAPNSNARLLERNDWDQFHIWLTAFCQEENCELYDGNLFRDRYELFNDQQSFNDESHLSSCGAAAFTVAFCDLLRRVDNGEDVSALFYSSYAEMMEDSPYRQYIIQ